MTALIEPSSEVQGEVSGTRKASPENLYEAVLAVFDDLPIDQAIDTVEYILHGEDSQ